MNKKLLKEELKRLKEELKRFNAIINYDPSKPTIYESEVKVSDKIVKELKPHLPLSELSGDVESILLLQKTLVALGKLVGDSGLDEDGVDGDFGNKTEKALYNTISDKKLTKNNISKFDNELKKNETKISNVINNYEDFIKRYKEGYGVSKNMLDNCKSGVGTKRSGSDKYYPNLDYVLKRKTCVSKEDVAKSLNKNFPDLDILSKSAILSTMIKEQGVGNSICGSNYNFSGIQTDSGRWGDEKLNDKISSLFCSKDDESVRSFASFDNLNDGIAFMKVAFDKRNWFIDLLKDVNKDKVDSETFDLEKVSKKNSDIWQKKWNLKLDSEEYEDFKKYGFNSKLKNQPFTNDSGIYNKSVDELTDEEKKIHNNHIKYYRSPEKIKQTFNSNSQIFKQSFNIFKSLKGKTGGDEVVDDRTDFSYLVKDLDISAKRDATYQKPIEIYKDF
jgi:hypothetical protein